MGKKRNNSRHGIRDGDPAGYDAFVGDEGDDELDEEFEPGEDAPYNGSFGGPGELKPMRGRRVWLTLALIMVSIAVAVLYVYQTGDKKTILGNQPIPANQGLAQAQPGVRIPNNGTSPNVPFGGGRADPLGRPRAAVQPGNTVQCPVCGMSGVPICGACGGFMRPLNDGSGLYVCTSCGAAGIPLCPHCHAKMCPPASAGNNARAATSGGQFQCPACGATGLPNWDPNGRPLCPSCGTPMKVRSASPTLAAAP